MTAWAAICTQWVAIAPGDGSVLPLALDYARVRAGLDLAGIAVTPETWAEVQLIEAGAKEEMTRGR